ncbi:MAG: T9SS type A sorting domain-containing protein, partial [Salibacteraceae bacterium]
YINKPVAELDVKIYPNPTTNSISVDFQQSTKTTLKVFSIAGVELAHKQVFNTAHTTFDLGTLPKGMYLLQVSSELGSQSVKVFKE